MILVCALFTLKLFILQNWFKVYFEQSNKILIKTCGSGLRHFLDIRYIYLNLILSSILKKLRIFLSQKESRKLQINIEMCMKVL